MDPISYNTIISLVLSVQNINRDASPKPKLLLYCTRFEQVVDLVKLTKRVSGFMYCLTIYFLYVTITSS